MQQGGSWHSLPLVRRQREAIAARIRARREELNLSPLEVYRQLGVTRWVYRRWENADRSIPSEALATLAHVLRVDANDLAHGRPMRMAVAA